MVGENPEDEASSSRLLEIKARISGVFYRSADPEAAPFVEVGSRVAKGHTLGLLESMKLYAKIKAPVEGEVVSIQAVNGQPVVVGQTLFTICPTV